MNRVCKLALCCIALGLLAGCAGRPPTGAPGAAALSKWLDAQQFSVWQAFNRTGGNPGRPASPDGLTLGSPNVFAAIGAQLDDLTSLDVFWADQRTERPLAKPLTIDLSISGSGIRRQVARKPVALSGFPEEKLKRIRHTSIAVSETTRDDLKVTIVDFAPMDPKSNFLCRWFMVENVGKRVRSVDLMLKTVAPGEPERLDGHAYKLGDKLAIVSDAWLRFRAEQMAVEIGRIDPGERASAAVLLTASRRTSNLKEHIDAARGALPHLAELLDQTKADWEAWCAQSPLNTGDERVDDLLDSMLCLIRAHIGPDAIHTGSLRYPHDRAWVRDSYWAQRALLELGHKDEAKLNLDFFHTAWRASGVASSYDIATHAPHPLGYDRVELPHYLVLMVRDAERMGGVSGAAYWDMVQACLDEAAVSSTGLQPMNGDETWLLAAPVRELDSLLDNSWLLIASAEYGADLATRMGDAKRAAFYQSIVSHAQAGLERFMSRNAQTWFASGYGADGSRDLSLCPEVLARAAILGVIPAADPRIASGLTAGWNRLGYERGIRTHARSATVSGGTPGYVLYAAADSPSCTFVPELVRRTLEFASATGCVWEFHDLYDPAWGGEKRRLWDSAVVLMGMVHALFRTQPDGGSSVGSQAAKLQFMLRPQASATATIPPPPFDAQRLVRGTGPLIFSEGSPQHAVRIARELIRQRSERFAIMQYPGQPPAGASAIIVSRNRASAGWRQVADYWVREWTGPPQLWVQNKGHVYLDTDRVVNDLVSYLAPKREKPLPFPDANFAIAARFGEAPSGEAEVAALSLFRHAEGRLNLAGGQVKLTPGSAEVTAYAVVDRPARVLKLTVTTAPHKTEVEAAVTLPAGWWVVFARDMTGAWDRVFDPVGETRLPDGRIRLDYTFRPSDRPLSLTFSLARLAVPSS